MLTQWQQQISAFQTADGGVGPKPKQSLSDITVSAPLRQHLLIRQAIDALRNIWKSLSPMDDAVAHFSYDLTALRLEYKTTSDALSYWRGGDPAEQQFLVKKKQEVFRALAEASLSDQFGH